MYKRNRFKIIRIVSLIILVLLFKYSFSQGLYEIRYQFYDNVVNGQSVLGDSYRALLFYYGPNDVNNIIRVRYYDKTDGWVVVEQKVKVKFTEVNGKQSWVLACESPQFITKVSQGAKYYPDIFSLSKNTGELFYTPDYAYTSSQKLPFIIGKINSFTSLDRSRVTNIYLSDFNWKWLENNNTPDINLTHSTLHLVLVSNSNDPRLGTGFLANHKKLKSIFTDVANSCNLNLDLVELTGTNFTKQNILSAVSGLYSNPNDIIIFYYSGHGFRFPDQASKWPRMELRSGLFDTISESSSLNIDEDIYKPLKRKGAGLTIVIGECCNTVPETTPVYMDPMQIAPGENLLSPLKAKSLMNQKGEILIATCSPNQSSYYYSTTGGFFCNNFIQSFLNNLGFNSVNNASWATIFNRTIDGTKGEAFLQGKKQDPYEHIVMQ